MEGTVVRVTIDDFRLLGSGLSLRFWLGAETGGVLDVRVSWVFSGFGIIASFILFDWGSDYV